MTFAHRVDGARAEALHRTGLTWLEVARALATEIGRPIAYSEAAVSRAAKAWRERQP